MGRYRRGERLGAGAYGEVFAAVEETTGRSVAVKSIPLTRGTGELCLSAVRELAILHQLRACDCVVQLLDVAAGAREVHLVLERMDTDLKAFLARCRGGGGAPGGAAAAAAAAAATMAPALLRALAWQLLRALAVLHSAGIVHRDLKPANLLLRLPAEGGGAPTLKIADFGLARAVAVSGRASGQALTPEVVTLCWRAPEVVCGGAYGAPVDLWSAGAIIAETAALGALLFPARSEVDLMRRIFSARGSPDCGDGAGWAAMPYYNPAWPRWACRPLAPLLPGVHADAVNLVERLLAVTPAARLSAGDALGHPFFRPRGREVAPSRAPAAAAAAAEPATKRARR